VLCAETKKRETEKGKAMKEIMEGNEEVLIKGKPN
jgi:hypothetical protein